MSTTRTVTSVVDGQPVTGSTMITSSNPARPGEVVADVSLADASVFLGAAESAKKAQPGWAAVPAPVRGRAIAHIGRLIEANAEALARIVTAEIGKPYAEALGEVREIVDTCDFFLGEGRRLYGQTVPSEMPDKQLFTYRKPVGTMAIITAGNFPVAVPSWYIVPALLAGNTVVWKPAEYAAASAAAFHDLIVRGGGLPDGVLNIVHADGAGHLRRFGRGPGGGLRRQGRLHRLLGRRARDRRPDRAAPADGVPGTGRQEPARRHPECRSRSRRGGRAVLRLRHRWPALHQPGHGHRARAMCTTSS